MKNMSNDISSISRRLGLSRMSGHDPLIDLAVSLFMQWVGEDLVGAPFVELHDVIDPNVGVDIALDRAAAELGVAYITKGEPWYALCSAVAEAYDEWSERLLEI